MSKSITTLANLLHFFNGQFIQRSLAYVAKIDQKSLERTETSENIMLTGYVKGSQTYRTSITFNKASKRIITSNCTCPVRSFCKHGAALARLLRDQENEKLNSTDKFLFKNQQFVQDLMQQIADLPNPTDYKDLTNALAQSLTTTTTASMPSSKHYDEANLWLKNLRQNLIETDKTATKTTQKTNGSAFIYQIEQVFGKLRLHLMKVRRGKAGDIHAGETYTQFSNLAKGLSSVSHEEAVLFGKIYHHLKAINSDGFYTPYLIANDLPVDYLKELLATKTVFSKANWDKHWQSEQDFPLTWTDEILTLDIDWLENPQQGEKLQFNLLDHEQHRYGFGQHENLDVLFTQPLTYINRAKAKIGLVNSEAIGDMPSDVLYRLLTMPPIPSELVTEIDEVLSKSPTTQRLPKPKAVQNIEDLYGEPQPIVQFSNGDDLNLPWQYRSEYVDGIWIQKKWVLTELSFAYTGGETIANTDEFFIGKKDGKKVRQHQDKDFEKQAIKQLKQLFPSFTWLKKDGKNSKFEAHIEVSDVLSALLPTDKINQIGWQVEHADDSPVNAQSAIHPEFILEEADNKADDGNHWFEVGAVISDSEGHRYDLLSIVGHLLEVYPYLLNPKVSELIQPEHLFAVEVGGGRPNLAIAFQDILPILQNLRHLLSQDERKLDRYDTLPLIELAHTLGMAWQLPDKLKTFAEKLKAGYQSNLPTPNGFHGELRPYQQQGLAWLQFLADTEHGGILADDMGLGKTAQTLAHVLIEKQAGRLENKPVLIVAPTSLMHNWQKEAEKFTPDLSVLLLHGANRHDKFEQINAHDIMLTTYPLVVRDEEILKAQPFHQIILDEAQNIKNPHSKSAQVLRSLTATHRLCLTGTPMENHLGELWSLFYFLMPGFLGSQDVFNKHYRHPIEKKGDKQKRQKLVNRTKPFILRRLKTDVAKELPPKTTIEVNIDMNDEQSKLYEAVRATMQKNIQRIIAEQGFKRSQIQILEALLKLRQVCCHPSLLNLENLPTAKKTQKHKAPQSAKLDYLIETVSDMVAEGRKILIFSQFTSMLALIEQRLNEQKIAFSKLTGQTKKRSEAIEAFQSGQVPVFLISLKAGGVGLNLTAADTVIHYDPWWNPAVEDQASDRAWRIGQDKPVFVYKLITNQSIEEKIIDMQKNKAELAQSILSIDHEGEVKLSEEAVLGLFERIE